MSEVACAPWNNVIARGTCVGVLCACLDKIKSRTHSVASFLDCSARRRRVPYGVELSP